MTSSAPLVPVSWGEAIDRLTILEIKSARLTDDIALANVRKELAGLDSVITPGIADNQDIAALKTRLRTINETLWKLEDAIREKEAAGTFDAEFVGLARSIYKNNDERGAVKRQINVTLGSALMEEKSYKDFPASR